MIFNKCWGAILSRVRSRYSEFFYTDTGFGVKKISKESVDKNREKLKKIANQGKRRTK